MTSTTVLGEDTATIVNDETRHFDWSAVIAGAVGAVATTFFLATLGAGIGLALVASPRAAVSAPAFFTLGAIYFFASQAFGFAVGGYLVGRLIGPEVETTKEEEFRAAAHGFVMWALVVVASLLIEGFAPGVAAAGITADTTNAAVVTDRAASIITLWTAFALLFGAIVAVATAISARWMDDKVSFSFAPRNYRR